VTRFVALLFAQTEVHGAAGTLMVVAICLAFVAVGVALVRRSLIIWRTWQRTTGTVVDQKRRRTTNSDGTTSEAIFPVFEFTLADGGVHRVCDPVSASFKSRIGCKIKVAYDPAAPDDARIFSPMWILGFPILITAVGAGVLVAFTVSKLG
jgi:hypothetical protein